MTRPLLRLQGVWRRYGSGDHEVAALRGIDLTIEAGEYIAIIGPSGSGKTTLMNILGCLDKPTEGSYEVSGRDTAMLAPDDLAALRREHFGFIFQRYHLLADLNAQGNVEVPAAYAGWDHARRHARSAALLERLGLGHRMDHRPNQLSGGQQQRVSVARALMNGGEVILADEPTGALDSKSGAELLNILDELSLEGHTVILVTHDPHVAEHAHRVIEIKDGVVAADRVTQRARPRVEALTLPQEKVKESFLSSLDRIGDAFRMAVLAMNAHRLRTLLTMLGIIIGIASVVTIVALGAGSQKAILREISTMGSNTIAVYPGRSAGDPLAANITSLNVEDVRALQIQPYADSVTPAVETKAAIRAGSVSIDGTVHGVGEQFFRVRNIELSIGRVFDASAVARFAQEVVIDEGTRQKLFPGGGDPTGKVIFLGDVPFRVLGVTAPVQNTFFGADGGLQVWAPYTTVQARMLYGNSLRSVTVRMPEGVSSEVTEEAITRLLTLRHGSKDFYMVSSDSVRRTVESVTLMLSLLIGAIGGISLIVGGLGVMNIMLVSVSERTREIGVRTAIGARRSDIMSQFIIEAVLVCLIGGALGVGFALLLGFLFSQFVKSFELIYAPSSIVAAFIVASLIGLVFGWLPARNASRLDPVDALSRE